jgi:tetratricopeptide (TPR) repeat protein
VGAYESAGRLGEAISLYEQTLADTERVLGADHPDTLDSRSNLAGAYGSAGRLGEAIPLYQQTLADRQRVLDADHPDTLTSRNNLASGYESAGRLGEAIPLHERTLADCERVLGDQHLTRIVRANLSDAVSARNAQRRGRWEGNDGHDRQLLASRPGPHEAAAAEPVLTCPYVMERAKGIEPS